MAEVIISPTGSGPESLFEAAVVGQLAEELPDGYRLLPNFSLKEPKRAGYEYDLVIFAPHAIYVVEAKEWFGRLTGDDTEWLLNQTPKRCPLWLVNQKCKVLKSRLGALGNQAWVEPLLVVPDVLSVQLGGNWASNVTRLSSLAQVLQDSNRLPHSGDIGKYAEALTQALTGAWAARRRDQRRRIGGFEVTETIAADEDSGEFLAERALVSDPTPYRIRTWHVSPYLSPRERQERVAVISRPTEAIGRVGRHANLLPILDFAFNEDENEYYEITEWSEYGTLHGYLRNSEREPLTIRERLEIAAGVASALQAVHARGLVHRNVCPETIVIGFDRLPRLTDFDRAYVEKGQTVFAATVGSGRNPAYVPPELADPLDYKFDACSDMYSLGMLLYELLTDRVAFADPKSAAAAHGRPDMLPSKIRSNVDPALDDLVLRLLATENYRQRPTASEALGVIRQVLGVSAPDMVVATVAADRWPEPGDLLNGNLRVDASLGSGAFSRVYKVYHLDQQKPFAMKILGPSTEADMLLREFRDVGQNLPTHPNIAKMIWMDRLPPPQSTLYILSEYIEGETLEAYCDGRKQLSWNDIKGLATKLLGALEAMHPKEEAYEKRRAELGTRSLTPAEFEELQRLREGALEGFLHRDIKPANIMLELPAHSPKLIDFNIASPLSTAAGLAGTPRYWAPDRGQPSWRPNADLFSLGVVLYELVTHTHPFPDNRPEAGEPSDPRVLRPDLNLSEELADFLLRAVQPSGSDRFQTAREMKAALSSVASMHAAAPPLAASHGGFPGITLTQEEKGRSNYNPYVTRLLTLYSQARHTNAGTRGLDDIAKLTYVNTKLDDRLGPAIAAGRFRLVVVTGNAGDGKTAFLQQVEQFFRKRGVGLASRSRQNGNEWTDSGLRFSTNYDGSQDEGDTASDDALSKFLEPFSDAQYGGLPGSTVRLLAINEGRLLDFLEHSAYRGLFTKLRVLVHHGLTSEGDVPDWALVVNLNLRSVSAGGKDSLVERQLLALINPTLWAPCTNCEFRMKCPLKFNADSLNDEASGQAVRSRVRRLLEIVHLRRRAHVTIRDLRSALSWLLLRDHNCDDVATILRRGDAQVAEDLVALYYPSAFASGETAERATVDDRLVRLLREADVGLVSSPQLDRRLDHDPTSAVPWMSFDRRSKHFWDVLRQWTSAAPRTLDDAPLDVLLRSRRRTIGQWRRWAYFERRDDGWEDMLPYRSLLLLEAVTNALTDNARVIAAGQLRAIVVEAVSISEGLRHAELRKQFLGLRVSRIRNPSIRSYRLFPVEEFTLTAITPERLSEYLEYAPSAVELVVNPARGVASLRIPLDLLEMLELIRNGYRPSPGDLQGLFVNLVIFRNELLNLPYDRVVLTRDDDDLYELTATTRERHVVHLALERLTPPASQVEVTTA